MKHLLTAIMILCAYSITSGQYAATETSLAQMMSSPKNVHNDIGSYSSGTFGQCISDTSKGLSTCTMDALIQYLSEEIEYPESAMVYDLKNTCNVDFTINISGQSTDINVSHCPTVFFERPIVTALQQLEWQPVIKSGKAINYGVQLKVKFK